MTTLTKSKVDQYLEKRKEAAELRMILEKWQNFYSNEAIFHMKSDTLSLLKREMDDLKCHRDQAELELRNFWSSMTLEEREESRQKYYGKKH
ncbi:hypothetical protein [Cytobacillus oceanisediminis]|uniref:hypothetical protein n=1 Tax=Cytobacillus oceanisediminis TaxID=665099 RepID=UPI001FB44C00|nr:hypothetical protein [Cytobacillus oceanisediminis]UOE58192.1 hypothetical protein IRB79_27195 [Cytobacillus oceanisediminis]